MMMPRRVLSFAFDETFFSKRTRGHIWVGALAIIVSSAALLLIQAFSKGVDRFSQYSYQKSRSIIGTIVAKPRRIGRVSEEEMAKLEKDVVSIEGLHPDISWVSIPRNRPEMYRNEHQRFSAMQRQDLFIGCFSPESPLLQEEFGFQLLYGEMLEYHPKDKLHLGVMLNISYFNKLEKQWSDAEMTLVKRGNGQHLIPKFSYLDFPPIPATPDYVELGRLPVKVVGVFDIDDPNFPHVLATEDLGQVFYYQAREGWEPSFALVLHNYLSDKPFYSPAGGIKITNPVSLPSRKRLNEGEGQVVSGITRFQKAYLHLTDEKLSEPGFRAKIKEELQKERLLLSMSEPQLVDKCTALLNELRIPTDLKKALDAEMNKLIDRTVGSSKNAEAGLEDFVLPSLGQEVVRPDGSGNRWTIENTDSLDQWMVRLDDSILHISKLSPWEVTIPSDNVTSTLNRIRFVVDTYSAGIQIIVMSLTCLGMILFGFGHYFRKRKDLGLMKACGMHPFTLGVAFTSQVLVVCVVGFAMGIGMSLLLAHLLEPAADNLLDKLSPNSSSAAGVVELLAIDLDVVLDASWKILLSALVGGVMPAIRAARIKPIEDLNTGI